MLAKGQGKVFFITEVFACGIHLVSVYIFTRFWGIEGAGIAFLLLYVIYTLLMLFVMHRLVGATWSLQTTILVLLSTLIMIALMLSAQFNLPQLNDLLISIPIICLIITLCAWQLICKLDLRIGTFFTK